MKRKSFVSWLLLLLFPLVCLAAQPQQGLTKAPQPTTCIIGTFTSTGGPFWKDVSLQLKNQCGQTVDVQNTTITFINSTPLNTGFWGVFGNVTYPDNTLQITSQPDGTGNYLATLSFHIPEADWANSKLPNNATITLYYGAETAGYNASSLKVYLPNNTPPSTGSITLLNTSAKPANVTQNYAVVNLLNNGSTIQSVQLAWLGSQNIQGLNPGIYSIQAINVTGTSGSVYQGTANPATLTLAAGQNLNSNIKYALVTQPGQINVKVPALPAELSGYTNIPIVSLTNTSDGSTTTKAANWNATTTISQLVNGVTYHLATPDIIFNNFRCTGNFTPKDVASSSSAPPTASLAYTCVQINQVNVSLNVSGLTSATTGVDITLTPNDGTSPVVKHVDLTNGGGSNVLKLTQGTLYNVSSTTVSGFNAAFKPQPLLAANSLTETVTYTAMPPQTGGRTIGYIPGWKTPPSATDLANAGYTHVLIAFGVFSTTTPGSIVPAFDTVTKTYIDALHNAGIKVLLSLGGASSSVPNTTVDFHQVLQLASSPTVFQQTFVQSVKSLIAQYGFDGVDIDIEQGLGVTGTMQSPTGDVAVLANIINQLHNDLPSFLISMVPQAANISATSGFDATWANYSALIMQTHNALAWVGVQLYNTGCMFGIDHVCYDPSLTSSPNFSVAMATDLLESWPQKDSTGRPTGFQPYIGLLNANQIVIGYPSPDAQGNSDGRPVTPTATIKNAIQCLKAGVACGSYVPPKAYGLIGGVFNWEVTYDQNNQFKFARDLKACVTTGVCN